MKRYSTTLMTLALPALILAPWVVPDARFLVWAAGSAAALVAALFYVIGD